MAIRRETLRRVVRTESMADMPELRGSVVPIVTPLNADLKFDAEACRRMADDLFLRGAGGIVALGTTGEIALVPRPIRPEMLAALSESVAGRVPFIVCCGSPSLPDTEREIREAAAFGADYCLVVPSYFLSLGIEEILREFNALRSVSSVPLLYYRIPVRGGAEIVRALHANGLVSGLKDSGGLAPEFAEAMLEIRSRDGGFEILLGGSSKYLQAAALGIAAVTSVSGCIAPEIENRLLAHLQTGRIADAAAEQRKLARAAARSLGQSGECRRRRQGYSVAAWAMRALAAAALRARERRAASFGARQAGRILHRAGFAGGSVRHCGPWLGPSFRATQRQPSNRRALRYP